MGFCGSNLSPIAKSGLNSTFWGGVAGGALGGTVGGAITGGLLGGTRGALQGAMYGAAFGAAGGMITQGLGGMVKAGVISDFARDVVQNGMMIGSGAYSAATGSADMFAGALIGGMAGYRFQTGSWQSPWSATSKPNSPERISKIVNVTIDSVEATNASAGSPAKSSLNTRLDDFGKILQKTGLIIQGTRII